jgi:hypothetical protein
MKQISKEYFKGKWQKVIITESKGKITIKSYDTERRLPRNTKNTTGKQRG